MQPESAWKKIYADMFFDVKTSDFVTENNPVIKML